jgi:hypothetical protein
MTANFEASETQTCSSSASGHAHADHLAEGILTQLLATCLRVESDLTLHKIVAQVLDEKPQMWGVFASGWEELIRRKHIRLRKVGRPAIYEVIRAA